MAIYLALGSNQGDRRENLRMAVAALAGESVAVERISAVVESPALLPDDALPDWNSPFLNLVARCRSPLPPSELLTALKRIESRLGRSDPRRWSPRPIDIDILLYDDRILDTDELRVPHPGLPERAFFLTPLAALDPGLVIPGIGRSALELARRAQQRIPLWMGIVNVTPDSFSDGGSNQDWAAAEQTIEAMLGSGVHILDFGAESTRPGATPLSAGDEWRRLDSILRPTLSMLSGDPLRPLISVDTYHASVAENALALGVDMINDVGGLTDPGMVALAGAGGADFVAMHNLGLPAARERMLAGDASAVDQVEAWLDAQLERWRAAGLDHDRVIFDPGIGFGKNPLQSLDLLRNIDRFHGKGLRLLVGHSRKSFMQGFAGRENSERDLVTIGASLALCEQRADILRVHNVSDHVTAYRGWSHLKG